MQGQIVKRRSTSFYVSGGGETFDSISKRLGIPVDELMRLNPTRAPKTRFAAGDSIIISLNDGDGKASTGVALGLKNAAQTGKNAINKSTSDETAADEKTAQKAAQQAKVVAEKKAQYRSEIKAAEENHALDVASAQSAYERNIGKLATTLKESRAKLESDLAKQKISDSSIAGHENAKLIANAESAKSALDTEYSEKIKKLAAKLKQTKEAKQQKIDALG